LNLAKTYAMLSMYDEAKVEFLEVLRLDQENKEAKRQLIFFEGLTEDQP